MKPQQLVLILTTTALGLVAAIAYVKRPVGELSSAPALETTALLTAEASPAAPAPAAVAPPPPPEFSWRQVESEDYQEYIANLRSIGCPEQTIRDIIVADVNKLYAARENALKKKPEPGPDGAVAETPAQELERLRQLRAVQQEKRWVVKELLDVDLPLDLLPSSGSRDYHAFEVALSSLPAEKRDAVQFLQEDYWKKSDALKEMHEKKKTPEFVAEYRQLNDSLRQELAKLLTPQELEDYDIRTSATAKQLGAALATYFRPSESEFRQIYRAKTEYEDAIQQLSALTASPAGPVEGADPKVLAQQRAAERQALEQARASAQARLDEQIKSALGDERYSEYQRSQDRPYDLLARLGMRYGLPQEKVLEAYEFQKSFAAPPGDGSPQGTPANRADLQRQLNEQLTAILGEQAARGYRRVHGGSVPVR